MPATRNDSLLKNLAIAFGDGLAFAAGMKLSQRAVNRRPAAAVAIPQPSASIDRRLVEAVVQAVEDRIKKHSAQMERRISELETQVATEWELRSAWGEATGAALAEIRASFDARLADLRASFRAEVQALRGRQQAIEENAAPRDLLRTIGHAYLAAADSTETR
ncbi:MAG TPA: hypothetical protein VMU19_01090 [Bryobacteraceae bacterium]|nr:hypothetical protein [Bryobacteraceae bacterium]